MIFSHRMRRAVYSALTPSYALPLAEFEDAFKPRMADGSWQIDMHAAEKTALAFGQSPAPSLTQGQSIFLLPRHSHKDLSAQTVLFDDTDASGTRRIRAVVANGFYVPEKDGSNAPIAKQGTPFLALEGTVNGNTLNITQIRVNGDVWALTERNVHIALAYGRELTKHIAQGSLQYDSAHILQEAAKFARRPEGLVRVAVREGYRRLMGGRTAQHQPV